MAQNTAGAAAALLIWAAGPAFPSRWYSPKKDFKFSGWMQHPTFVAAFERNLPGVPIVCESVLESRLFDRIFDAVLSIGLMFLLKAEDQHRLIQRFAEILVPGGRLLFTATANPVVANDAMTGLESVSLGAEEQKKLLGAAGISGAEEF